MGSYSTALNSNRQTPASHTVAAVKEIDETRIRSKTVIRVRPSDLSVKQSKVRNKDSDMSLDKSALTGPFSKMMHSS